METTTTTTKENKSIHVLASVSADIASKFVHGNGFSSLFDLINQIRADTANIGAELKALIEKAIHCALIITNRVENAKLGFKVLIKGLNERNTKVLVQGFEHIKNCFADTANQVTEILTGYAQMIHKLRDETEAIQNVQERQARMMQVIKYASLAMTILSVAVPTVAAYYSVSSKIVTVITRGLGLFKLGLGYASAELQEQMKAFDEIMTQMEAHENNMLVHHNVWTEIHEAIDTYNISESKLEQEVYDPELDLEKVKANLQQIIVDLGTVSKSTATFMLLAHKQQYTVLSQDRLAYYQQVIEKNK